MSTVTDRVEPKEATPLRGLVLIGDGSQWSQTSPRAETNPACHFNLGTLLVEKRQDSACECVVGYPSTAQINFTLLGTNMTVTNLNPLHDDLFSCIRLKSLSLTRRNEKMKRIFKTTFIEFTV